jgi:phytoene synthase
MITEIFRLPYTILRPVYEKTSFHRAVIDELEDAHLKIAYTRCREIIRTYAKTFYMATRFLPTHKQRSIFAVYALCRYLDDLVDETEDLLSNNKLQVADVEAIMLQQKKKLAEVYQGKDPGAHPIFVAIADVLKTYHIPIELPYELIEGVCMDLTKKRYANFDELYVYSYKVASVVGLMTSEIFGYTDKKALDHAIELGIAMQLTNILRDIGEDLGRDRIYLPADEMKSFGITEAHLFSRSLTPVFIEFMEFQIQRAEKYYLSSDQGIAMLSADSRLPVSMARQNYSRILQRIRSNNYQVFHQRAHLSTVRKLAILPRVWLGSW